MTAALYSPKPGRTTFVLYLNFTRLSRCFSSSSSIFKMGIGELSGKPDEMLRLIYSGLASHLGLIIVVLLSSIYATSTGINSQYVGRFRIKFLAFQ